MEIHFWKGKNGGITVELNEVQEAAVMSILGLDIDYSATSYRCYTDETVIALIERVEKALKHN